MVSDKISVGKLVVHDGHREPALCGCEQKEVAHPLLKIRKYSLFDIKLNGFFLLCCMLACDDAAQYAPGTASLATLIGGVYE
jgi:hypothetical protein